METFQNGGQRLSIKRKNKGLRTDTLTSQPNTLFRIPWEEKFDSRYMCFSEFSIDCRKRRLNASMDIHSFVAVFVIAKIGGFLDNSLLVRTWP